MIARALLVVALFAVGAPTARGSEALILPVPIVTIYPGETIAANALGTARFRPTMPARNSVAHEAAALVGMVATRTLLPRRAVPVKAVREPDLVDRGEIVDLVFEKGALTIRAKAITLGAGMLGGWVRTRNLDSGRIVSGTVASDGSIMVGDAP